MKKLLLLAILTLSAFAQTQSVTVNLTGVVTDDSTPAPTVQWTKVSGPGTVVFANAASAVTSATIDAPGTYVLRLTANDGSLSASDDVTITVLPANKAPIVNAGPDQTVTMPTAVARTVVLNWVASTSPNVDGYHVYCSTTATERGTRLTATPVSAPPYEDVGRTAGTYYYVVTAVAGSLESDPSNQAVAVVM